MADSSPPASGRPPRASGWLAGVLAAVLVVHAVALYMPGSPDVSSPAGFDKVVHLGLFAVPAAVAVLAGGSWRRRVPALLVAHAVVSELVQGAVVPNRSGDPWDAFADVIGVLLGWAAGVWLAARVRGRTAYGAAGRPG